MANKHRGEVRIKIGGMERNLKFNMNTIAEIEELLDKTLQEFLQPQKLGVRELRALLFNGVQWEGTRLTLNQVGEMITPKNYIYLAETVGKALNAYLGEADKAENSNEDALEDGDEEKN